MKIREMQIYAVLFAAVLFAAGCGYKEAGAAGERTAAEHAAGGAGAGIAAADEARAANTAAAGTGYETAAVQKVVEDGMTPIYGSQIRDGVYQITADSSSNMFKITACQLTVKDGAMTAVMTMGGTGYLKLYMGTGKEALNASEGDFIPYVETSGKAHTFTVPVKALDMGIDCSAFSKNKEKWYDRVLVFRADSLPIAAFTEGTLTTAESLKLEDGMYTAEVALGGGSGRASVESPAALRVEKGKVYAAITWGSANYDYMKVGDVKYNLIDREGNSTFEIPVDCFDRKLPVIADTTAMSQPHEVEYTLTFDSATLKKANDEPR